MRPVVDRVLVHRVAGLASLSLSDAEADVLAGELAAILDHVALLDGLDALDAPDAAGVAVEVEVADGAAPRVPLRADVLVPGLSHAEALAQAPRVEGEGFAVPAFVEEK